MQRPLKRSRDLGDNEIVLDDKYDVSVPTLANK